MHQLAEVFAVSLWADAVMSNHLHVVVQVLPEAAAQWADARRGLIQASGLRFGDSDSTVHIDTYGPVVLPE